MAGLDDVTNPEEQEQVQTSPSSEGALPSAATKKRSAAKPSQPGLNEAVADPEYAKEHENKVRSYYQKQLDAINAKEQSIGERWGLNDLYAQFGAPTAEGRAQMMGLRQKELETTKAGKKEAFEGLQTVDQMKQAIAVRTSFNDAMKMAQDAEAKGDFATADAYRNKAKTLDANYYKLYSEAGESEAAQSALGKEVQDLTGLRPNQPGFKEAMTDLRDKKLLADQAKKGQLSSYQRVQAEEKYRENDELIGTTEKAIKQSDDFIKQVTSTITHKGMADATGYIAGRLPAFTQEGQNFRNLLETVSSQTFLSNIAAMKGMGALSNAEGEKIASAQAAIKATNDPKELKKQLGIIVEVLRDNKITKEKELKAKQNYQTEVGRILGKPPVEQKPADEKPAGDKKPEEKKEPPPPPQVGQVIGGYRYKGGDPKLEASWEKA